MKIKKIEYRIYLECRKEIKIKKSKNENKIWCHGGRKLLITNTEIGCRPVNNKNLSYKSRKEL